MEILLDAPVPHGIPIADHPLRVEDDVLVARYTANDAISSSDKELILKSGVYEFDECMGEFGGFRIDLLLD